MKYEDLVMVLLASTTRRRDGNCKRWVAAVMATVMLTACDQGHREPATGPSAPPADLQRYVTGDAARALSPTGEFALPDARGPDGEQIITSQRAGDLAMAFVRTFGPSFDEIWERERGAPIDLSALRVEPRIYFAATPYERFPEGFHPAFRRTYGPFYLVTLSAGGIPALAFAVSAYNTDVNIDKYGRLVMPSLGGAGFQHFGVPIDAPVFAPLSPEEAVAHVGRATGARTERTPELVLVGRDHTPLVAAWRLALDRPVGVNVRNKGRRAEVREILIGPQSARRLLIPADGQPSVERASAVRIGPDGSSEGWVEIDLQIRPGYATKFDVAAPEGGR